MGRIPVRACGQGIVGWGFKLGLSKQVDEKGRTEARGTIELL